MCLLWVLNDMRLLVLTLALAGCTTTAGLQQRPADLTFQTSRSRAAFEECVAGQLSWLGMPSATRGERVTTIVYGNPNPAFTITVDDAGAVAVRHAIAPGSRFRRGLDACA